VNLSNRNGMTYSSLAFLTIRIGSFRLP